MLLHKHFENEFSEVLVDAESTFGVRTHVSVQPKLRDIETLAGLVVDTSSIYLKAPSRSSLAIVKESSVLGLETTAGALVEPLHRRKKRPRQLFSPPRHLKAANEIHGYDYEITTVPPLHANSNSSALFPSAGVNNGAEATENDEEKDYIWERDKISVFAQLVVDLSYVSPTLKMPPLPSDDIRIFKSIAATQRGVVSPDNVPAPLCGRENGNALETNKHDYIEHELNNMQHTFETLAQLVVDHSSSHSTVLRSSSNHVHDCEEMGKNKKRSEHQLQCIHERNLKLLPIPSILNTNLETINDDKKEPTGCGYRTFGHQWAGGCILVSPPASMKL